MTEQEFINVVPAVIADAAAQHRRVSDYLAAVPDTHDAIRASLASLGPIYADLRDAAEALLTARAAAYRDQAEQHATMATNLTAANAHWARHEQAAGAAMRRLIEDH